MFISDSTLIVITSYYFILLLSIFFLTFYNINHQDWELITFNFLTRIWILQFFYFLQLYGIYRGFHDAKVY
jgi:hypothetical protein